MHSLEVGEALGEVPLTQGVLTGSLWVARRLWSSREISGKCGASVQVLGWFGFVWGSSANGRRWQERALEVAVGCGMHGEWASDGRHALEVACTASGRSAKG